MQSVTSSTSSPLFRSQAVIRQSAGLPHDRLLAERFRQWIPGWGTRQLSFSDFRGACSEIGIFVVRHSLRDAYGYAFWLGSVPYIYLASYLCGSELVITAYHELAHIIYHPSHPEIFKRTGNLWNWSKCHRQAEIVGVMAWMPHRIADGMTADELMREFGVRRKVAEFRASLNLWMG